MQRAATTNRLLRFLFLLAYVGWVNLVSSAQVTISVWNDASVPERMLREAQSEARRIFQSAGLVTAWVTCKGSKECQTPRDRANLSLRLVPWSARGDSVFGVAFLSDRGEGAYGDVFYPSITKLHGEASPARLLGHVMAHEIGHLLLGTGDHSCCGIMSPHWGPAEFLRIGMGTLLFTPEQARNIRSRLPMTGLRSKNE